MREPSHFNKTDQTSPWQSFCLTNLSTTALIGWAGAVSALLWLCIWAVL